MKSEFQQKETKCCVEAEKKREKQETYIYMKNNSTKQTAVDGSPKRQ